MKILNYIIVSLIVLTTLFIWSCNNDTRSDDKTPPMISNVRFNVNDTIRENGRLVNGEMVYDITIINDSLFKSKNPDLPDTLIIGHSIRISCFIEDEGDGVSGVSVRIWGDTAPENNKETTSYRLRKSPSLNIFGRANYTIENALLENTLSSSQNREGENLKVRETVDEANNEYFYAVRCIDVSGNEDSVTYAKRAVHILSRDRILKSK